MRDYMDEFEMQPAFSEAGWAITETNLAYTTGYGGLGVCLTDTGTSAAELVRSFRFDAGEVFFKAHIQIGSTASNQVFLQFNDSGGTRICQVFKTSGQSDIGFRLGSSGAYVDNGAALSVGVWYLCEVFLRPRDSGGRIIMRIDGATYFDYTGDTDSSSTEAVSQILLGLQRDFKIDNVAIQYPSLSYDGGTGSAPAVGEVVTGGTSGATATVSDFDGDATSGRLILTEITGVFVDGEALTGDGALVAVVNAPTGDYSSGLEPHSSWAGNEIIALAGPSGNGNTSGLTGSDADQTDNYALVDEVPPSSVDYVENTTAGALYDTYALDFSAIPSTVQEITCVGVQALVQSDLTGIDNWRGVLRSGGSDYDGEAALPLPSSAAMRQDLFATQPDGTGAWNRADTVALEAGPKLEP